MVILRGTQKLRQRLPAADATAEAASTTVLGDWTCHLARFGRVQVIICMSHETLLPILLPARQAQTFPRRLTEAVAAWLATMGVPELDIAREVAAMETYVIAPTNNRQVLGSLNDFVRTGTYYVESGEPAHLLTVSRHLAKAPCKPIGYLSPDRAVAAAFGLK